MKDELRVRHRVNPILQFGSAPLYETRRALGLGRGQDDLAGVAFDLMAFDGASRDFAPLGADHYGSSHDPFMQAGREIVDLDPSVGAEVEAAALLQVVHQGYPRDLWGHIFDERNRRRCGNRTNAGRSE